MFLRRLKLVRAMAVTIFVGLPVCARMSFAQAPAGEPRASPTPAAQETRTAPPIGLRAMPGYGSVPLTVGFAVLTLGGGQPDFAAYHWNFGDGSVSALPPAMISHTYQKPGTYIVTFTGVTRDGQLVTALASVTAVASQPMP